MALLTMGWQGLRAHVAGLRTDSAFTAGTTAFAPMPDGIFFCVFVAVAAVGFLCVRSSATVDVDLGCNGFEMGGFDATAIAAQVVQL
jgi:hypothetical protein